MHVVLDDDLHAEPHVIGAGHDEQQHRDRDERRAEDLHHRGVIAAQQSDDDHDQRDGQRHVGDRGQALVPEHAGAVVRRAEMADAAERRAQRLRRVVGHRMASHDEIADDPDQDGEADRADQGRHGEPFALDRAEAVAQVPDQMLDAAQHVVDQRPGVAEQDQPPEQRLHEPLHRRIGVGAGGGGDQPPHQQQHAEKQRPAGDPVDDGHHHRQQRLVDLQVRRERAVLQTRCLGLGHYSHSGGNSVRFGIVRIRRLHLLQRR